MNMSAAAITPQQVTPPPTIIQGPKVMLLGESNSGKTHAIRTLCDLGLEVFVLATEPGIEKILGDVPTDKLHWNYLPPTPFSIDTLEKQLMKVNNSDLSGLCKPEMNRTEFRQTLDLMAQVKNFKCQRTGQSFGDVYKWSNNRAFVVDSLSGLTEMVINSWIGIRIGLDKSDYQVIQKCVGNLITSWCMGLNCWFVLTAHQEREADDVTLQVKVMASVLGKALAPRLPKYFDEVIHTKRDMAKFSWSNMTQNYLLKSRMLPFNDNLEPSFKLLNQQWRLKTGQQAAK